MLVQGAFFRSPLAGEGWRYENEKPAPGRVRGSLRARRNDGERLEQFFSGGTGGGGGAGWAAFRRGFGQPDADPGAWPDGRPRGRSAGDAVSGARDRVPAARP